MMNKGAAVNKLQVPLLVSDSGAGEEDSAPLGERIWVESKKLWQIVGPAIFSRLAMFTMSVITQAFAGHIGDLELASISIANTVVVGFCFGLLLGMASALETLCGQAYGAKKYRMMGVYMQRSWIVLVVVAILLLPIYFFAGSILKLIGQPDDVAEQAGVVTIWLIPLHFSFAFQFPLQRFLQCQLKNAIIAYISGAALLVHIFVSWLFVCKMQMGVVGAAFTLNFSWWTLVIGMMAYTMLGGCPETWKGFSMEAFSGLWEFVKLSAAAGVMLWCQSFLLILRAFVNLIVACLDVSLLYLTMLKLGKLVL